MQNGALSALIDPGAATTPEIAELAKRVEALREHARYKEVLAEVLKLGLRGSQAYQKLLSDERLQ